MSKEVITPPTVPDQNQLQGELNEPDKNKNKVAEYYDRLIKILDSDLKFTQWVGNLSWIFISVLTVLLVVTFCESKDFINEYLNAVKKGEKIPSDKVTIAIITMYAGKLIGIAGVLANFFFRKHPHQALPANNEK